MRLPRRDGGDEERARRARTSDRGRSIDRSSRDDALAVQTCLHFYLFTALM